MWVKISYAALIAVFLFFILGTVMIALQLENILYFLTGSNTSISGLFKIFIAINVAAGIVSLLLPVYWQKVNNSHKYMTKIIYYVSLMILSLYFFMIMLALFGPGDSSYISKPNLLIYIFSVLILCGIISS